MCVDLEGQTTKYLFIMNSSTPPHIIQIINMNDFGSNKYLSLTVTA